MSSNIELMAIVCQVRYTISQTHKAGVDGFDAVYKSGLLHVIVGQQRRPASEHDTHHQSHAE